MNLFIPAYIKRIMIEFEENGFESYIVGGGVRDQLLGLEPSDFDLTTNAVPDEIVKIIKKLGGRYIEHLGANYGVVATVIEGKNLEIATFRGERYGKDAHRPEQVWFCSDLREDLARRDFTVNALALSLEGEVIDYFEGRRDLENKILRTVGEAVQRFGEDALRMFRACRFVAQLDFVYEENLLRAIKQQRGKTEGLSLERVKKEIEKLLLAPHCASGMRLLIKSGLSKEFCKLKLEGEEHCIAVLPEVAELEGVAQNPLFHKYDVLEHTLHALANGRSELEVRWALLLHDLGKGKPSIRIIKANGEPSDPGHEKLSAELTEKILTRWQYGSMFKKRVVWLVANHMLAGFFLWTGTENGIKWLRRVAADNVFRSNSEFQKALRQLHNVVISDMSATNANEDALNRMKKFWQELLIFAETLPVQTKELAISGNQVGLLVGTKQIGKLLHNLLRRVQAGNLENTEEALLAAAQRWAMRYGDNKQRSEDERERN